MEDIIRQLDTIQATAKQEFFEAEDQESLANLRIKYLGKKSQISQTMKLLGGLSPEQRPIVGKSINTVKNTLQELYQNRESKLREEEQQRKLRQERIDVTLPGRRRAQRTAVCSCL